jgi:hypothetical protein
VNVPKTTGQILGQFGKDALPFGIGAGGFFVSNFVATGSFLTIGELTVLGGLGAGFALTGIVVVGALAVPAAIMLAVGNTTAAGEIGDAVHEAAPFISPGVLGLMPLSPFVTPSDPTLFAKAFGPGMDLATGVFSGGIVDRIAAQGSALAGLEGWKSDVINLGNYYLSSQNPTASGAGQGSNGGGNPDAGPSPNGGRPSPAASPEPSHGSGDAGYGGGFPFDSSAPGMGDSSTGTPPGDFVPVGTSVFDIRDVNLSQPEDGGEPPASDSGAGASSVSGDTGGTDDAGGDDAGSQNGGGDSKPGGGAGPGDGDSGSGGSGESSGDGSGGDGGDDGGGAD